MRDLFFWKSKRTHLFWVLLAVTVFELFDIIGDFRGGESFAHLLGEGLISFASFVGAVGLGRKILRQRAEHEEALENAHKALTEAKAEAARWKNEASTYLLGLSHAIDGQFQRWGLTLAEKEIGLLILKGLSLKEIAVIRNVSEKTVRAQSLAIYSKSGLKGRAELSAFFLEDLLVPTEG
ncbi:MAG: LuxR C-terminal-related transcriptional regulator [Oligoflexia bacterium]|nr:LuxR C-terminal-related transcriptional regulator [Oligoflexia bacterium]